MSSEFLNDMDQDSGYAYSLGLSLGNNYQSLDRRFQKKVWQTVNKNKTFASGLGKALALYNFVEDPPVKVEQLLEVYTKEHPDFGNGENFTTGAGYGLGEVYFEQKDRTNIWDLAKSNRV
jgi:hypothetical protein